MAERVVVSCMVRARLVWLAGAAAGPSILEVAPLGFGQAWGVIAGGLLVWVEAGKVPQLGWPSWMALEAVVCLPSGLVRLLESGTGVVAVAQAFQGVLAAGVGRIGVRVGCY